MFERDGSYWLLQISFVIRKILAVGSWGLFVLVFFFLLTLKSEKNRLAKLEENFKSYGLWQELSQLETFVFIFVSLPFNL